MQSAETKGAAGQGKHARHAACLLGTLTERGCSVWLNIIIPCIFSMGYGLIVLFYLLANENRNRFYLTRARVCICGSPFVPSQPPVESIKPSFVR
jgi:hypothetical protein